MLTSARLAEILRIRERDPGHPDYPAIKAAEARFIDDPISRLYVEHDRLPASLSFPLPKTDIEQAVQLMAINLLTTMRGAPASISFIDARPASGRRVAHAFRVARRTLLARRR